MIPEVEEKQLVDEKPRCIKKTISSKAVSTSDYAHKVPEVPELKLCYNNSERKKLKKKNEAVNVNKSKGYAPVSQVFSSIKC